MFFVGIAALYGVSAWDKKDSADPPITAHMGG
jgi:hypothetical protein